MCMNSSKQIPAENSTDGLKGGVAQPADVPAHDPLILIRCMSADPRVLELYSQLKESLPGFQIIAVPDLLRENSLSELDKFKEAGIPALPITKDYLASAGLAEAEARTGWVCGDYVFYRALELEWDYAWIVETDVYFLNGAERILAELGQLHHDLVGTGLRKEGRGWHWYEPLAELDLGMEVHAMSFPLVRMSREFTKQAYELRKTIATKIQPGQRMPNDESVVSSLAHTRGFSTLNIRKILKDVFKYYNVMTRYNIDDLSEGETEQRIVHSGRTPEKFDLYLKQQMKHALQGNTVSKNRILNCLQGSSKESAIRFVDTLLGEFTND